MASKTETGLGWYLDHIKSSPLLTADQEKQLSRRVREHSDPVARETMIQSNLRLVVKIAKEYSSPGMTLSDLVAEGNLGLMRGVEEFNPDAGVRFSTYAAWWIRQAINSALVNSGQQIRIPAYLVKFISRWRKTNASLKASLGRPPTTEEMAAELGVSKKKAGIISQGLKAVNAPSQMPSDETTAINEILTDRGENLPEQAMMDESNTEMISTLIESLDERSQTILKMRFGLDGADSGVPTYKQIGAKINLTRERVRQLEKKALGELKELVEGLV